MDLAASTELGSAERARWIALLGRRDEPTDGVEDYCDFLARALEQRGVEMKKVRVPWGERGWLRSLRKVWRESADWSGTWVLLQYTAFGWSRRGFPFGTLAMQWILRRRGARCAVVFHEPCGQSGQHWAGRLREGCQNWIVRSLYGGAAMSIFTIPLNAVSWLQCSGDKAAFIPIGANIPEGARGKSNGMRNSATRTVAVFCLTPGPNREIEVADAVQAVWAVRREGIPVRLVVLGRGTSEMREEIERELQGSGAEVSVLGMVPASEVTQTLSAADVQLFVSGLVSQRRGSALAGIACGLPIVGYEGGAAGTEIEQAGLSLVPYRDTEALGSALAKVLTDTRLHAELAQRTCQAQSKFFSWDAIAERYVSTLWHEKPAWKGTPRTLKVAIYAEYFLPIVGGVQTALKFLARGLALWRPNGDGIDLDQVALTLITQTAADGFDDAALPYSIVRRPGFFKLVRLIREADVIHVAGPCFVPLALGWLMGKRVVVEHHGYHAICPNGLLFYEPTRTPCPGHYMAGHYRECLRCVSTNQGFLRSLRLLVLQFPRRWLCKQAAGNIAISNHVGERSELPRCRTIYYGIEPLRVEAGNDFHMLSQPLHLGYVGRLVAEKGLPVLVKAAELLDRDGAEFQLTFVGDGPERNALESMVRSAGLSRKVTFTGNLGGEALDDALRGVSVVVMPTVMEETAGLGVIEQMMRGGVVIVSDIGGLSEVVDGFGVKFPPGDAEALYRCLKAIERNRAGASSIGRRAQQYALQRFTAERMAREHLSLYAQVAGHRGPSR